MSELSTILHVDDDQDILEIARMALQMVDSFDLHQYASGPDALAAIDGVAPDLLLLDVMMPGMTGPEFWGQLKDDGRHAGVPAIFMTAKAEDSMSKDLLQQGALDVITKPFDPMTLGAQIRAVWARRTA